MVRKERYFLRDLIFNEIHRTFGEGLFATDLDFLEFSLDKNNVTLSALIETKSEHAKLNFSRLQHRAQKKLANLAGIPYYTVKYHKPNYNVTIYPMNKLAKQIIPNTITMNLCDYAKFLYKIRGLKCPEYILERLKKDCNVHEIDRQYKLSRIGAMEKELIKLKKELGLNGYKKH